MGGQDIESTGGLSFIKKKNFPRQEDYLGNQEKKIAKKVPNAGSVVVDGKGKRTKLAVEHAFRWEL